MHVEIEADTRRGLRIIDEIPNMTLCKITGYNGIGKTNAIKLLSICVGDQPFQGDDASWQSFRHQLIRARVKVTHLRGAQSIEWELDPSLWPDTAEPLEHHLDKIRIDGKVSNYRDVRELLSVHHIITTETPLNVLAARVDTAREAVIEWMEAVGAHREQILDLTLSDAQKTIMRCVPAQVQPELRTAQDALQAEKDLGTQLQEMQQRAQLLDSAVTIADRLDQVRGRGPEMELKLGQLHARLAELDDQKQLLDEQITEASSRKHQNDKAEKEFTNARKFVLTKDGALREVTAKFERLVVAAQVGPDNERMEERRSTLIERLQALTKRLPQINATPVLITILEGIAERLNEAEGNGLGDVALIEPFDEQRGWTVGQLRDLCLRQVAHLSERASSAEAQALSTEISDIRAQIDTLKQATSIMQDVERAKADFRRAQERFRNASQALPSQAARTLEQLIKERNELDERSRTTQADCARLEHARDLLGGGMTEDALAAELLRLCRQAGVDAARVRGQRAQIRNQIDQLTRQHAIASHRAERARRLAEGRVSEVRQTALRLAEDTAFDWLRRVRPTIQQLPSLSVEEQASELDRLALDLENARNVLNRNMVEVRGVGAALTSLSHRLRSPHESTSIRNLLDKVVRLWLAEQVRQWFDDPMIADALFGGGRDITLHWQDLTIHWNVGDEKHQRPLTSFSSGQQAFAYTHARLAQLERSEFPSENRLVALDEFGSFLDGKRMKDLVTYLEKRRLRVPGDQVVVILPLEAAPMIDADSHPETVGQVRELEQRGYIFGELNRE